MGQDPSELPGQVGFGRRRWPATRSSTTSQDDGAAVAASFLQRSYFSGNGLVLCHRLGQVPQVGTRRGHRDVPAISANTSAGGVGKQSDQSGSHGSAGGRQLRATPSGTPTRTQQLHL